ncbi:MAG: cytochrome c maturation protein CcmE, partial [Acidobacteria bacterium]|nr:cytochrome c maturation protein CcmE [Acidobacteriota bacterium]MYH29997.1 cytochrome c maturation protein CcmE [Acidobacteriota bacterium]
MPDKAVKILLTTGILCTAFAGLLWATMQDGTQYYLEVEEVMA